MSDGATRDYQIAQAVRQHVRHTTGRLHVGDLAQIYQGVANRFGTTWAAVYLRTPAEILPTPAELEDWQTVKPPPPCPGCGSDDCADCARSCRDYGMFAEEELHAAMRHATEVGDLTYEDLTRELARRRARGQLPEDPSGGSR